MPTAMLQDRQTLGRFALLAGRAGRCSALMAPFIAAAAMGVAIYLALVAGGLTAAYLATVVLRGIKLI